MIQLTDSLFAVEVPEDANLFRIVHYTIAGTYVMQTDSKELNAWKVKLPKGSYTILGTIKEGKPDFEAEIDTSDLDTTKHWLILKTK